MLRNTSSSMYHGRSFHTDAVLPNGNVLVVGNCANDKDIATYTPEMYNSSADTSIPTDNMKNTQSSHKEFLLTNGEVLATDENNGTTFTNAEVH